MIIRYPAKNKKILRV